MLMLRSLDRKTQFATGVVLMTLLVHGLLAMTLFPADRQFFKYTQSARQYLENALPAERLFDLSPLYFYLHLLQNSILPGGEALIQGLQILLVALSAALLLLVLARYFPLGLATAGAMVFALNRSVVEYAAILEPEAFLLFFLLGFVYCCLQPKRGYTLASGIFFALCLLVRPNFLPLLLVVPLFFRVQEGPAKWLKSAGVFLAPALVAILLLTARNYAQLGTPSPMVMNPGYVFFEGNNPLSSGQSAAYPPLVGELKQEIPGQPDNPHVTYRLIARRSSGAQLSAAEVNAWWAGRAVNFILDNPLHFLQLLATKAYFLFHDFRRFDLPVAYLYDAALQQKLVPFFPFALVSAMALVGLAAAWRQRRHYFLCYAIFLLQAFLMLAMYVSDRQRVVLLPFFVFFACVGGLWLWERARGGLLLLPAVLLLALGLYVPLDIMRDDLYLWERYELSDRHWMEAVRKRDAGHPQDAANHAARSLAAAPWLIDYSRPAWLTYGPGGPVAEALKVMEKERSPSFSAAFDYGVMLLHSSRIDEAEGVFDELVKADRRLDRSFLQSSQPLYYLARVAALRGNLSQSIQFLEQAAVKSPGDPFVLAQLAAISGIDDYERLISRYFGEIDAAFLVGRACVENGRWDKAVEKLSLVSKHIPELRRTRIYLAASLGAVGDYERAAEIYLAATQGRSDPVLLEREILTVFDEFVTKNPGNAAARHVYGVALAHFGYFSRALEEQKVAYALMPGPKIFSEIQWLMKALQKQS